MQEFASEMTKTIATAGATAALVSGVILFAARRVLGGIIDSRIKRSDTEHAERLRAEIGRQEELFKAQVEMVTAVTPAIYELRDAARSISDAANSDAYEQLANSLVAAVHQYES